MGDKELTAWDRVEIARNPKLISIPTIAIIDGIKILNPFEYFEGIAKTISNNSAINKYTQFIL